MEQRLQANLGKNKMIDQDIYYTNPKVEAFLQLLKVQLNQDCHTTKVYISTASHDNPWLRLLYNNTKLTEEE